MNEELNQTQEVVNDEDLFLEEETTETENNEEVVDNDVEETPKEEPFLTIRYNKEDKALSKDDAIRLSQMGMNYEKVKGSYDSLNSRIENLARVNNLSVDEYLERMNELSNAMLESQEIKVLQEKYPEADKELLRELAKKNVENNLQLKNQTFTQTENRKDTELKSQISKFLKLYPDKQVDKLDDKVYELMDDGFSLVEAYQVVEKETTNALIKELEAKANIVNKNDINKAKSYGNIQSTKEAEETDDFLKAFNSI